MKAVFYSFVFTTTLLFNTPSLTAQWDRQYPLEKMEQVLDISAYNDGYGYAVGSNDLILRLDHDLKTWDLLTTWNKGWRLEAVDYLENTSGQFVAAGGQGMIVSDDYGATWDEIVNAPAGIHAIKMLEADRILVSSDVGVFLWENNDWTNLNLPVASGVGGAFLLDENHIWCFTNGTNPVIYYTTNGGGMWSSNTDIERPDVIRFYNTQYGVATDGRTVYNTFNGGQNWNVVSSNAIANSSNDLTFGSSANVMMSATPSADPAMSLDSGITWSTLNTGLLAQRSFSIASLSDNEFWLGNDISSIVHTTDGGNGWSETSGPFRNIMYDVGFLDRTFGIAVGSDGTILRTVDGGTSWEDVSFGDTRIYYSTYILDQDHAYIGANLKILASFDEGITWEEIGSFPGGNINDIYAITDQRILAASSSGIIYLTTDGGDNWDTVYTAGNQIKSISRIDNQRYMATGFSGLILRSENQGSTWAPVTVPEAGLQYEQSYFLGNDGWLVTSSFKHTMWHTTNAGDSWDVINLPIDRMWDGVYFISQDTGIVVCRSNLEGRAYITFNGGQTWQSGYITGFPLFGVTGIPNPNGSAWIFGYGSDIEVLPYCNTFPVIGDFTGNLFPCENDTVTYSVSSQDVDVFHWSFPPGWQILGNANNDTVTVDVGSNSGFISIVGTNVCGFSGQMSFSAGPILLPVLSNLSGDLAPCLGDIVQYTVIGSNVDTYLWNLPSDWAIVGSQNTSSVMVQVGSDLGFITVTGFNACDASLPLQVFVQSYALPQISNLSGDLTPCPGDTVIYSWDFSLLDQSYSIGVNPPGGLNDWIFLGSVESNQLQAIAGHESGSLYIVASNNCGNISSNVLDITPEDVPLVFILSNGPQLYPSETGVAYQWYHNGLPIPGATNDTLTPAANGTYNVEVTFDNGCSTLSSPVSVVISGIFNPGSVLPIELFPSPVHDFLYIKGVEGTYEFTIIDHTGKPVMKNITNEDRIVVSMLPEGLYMLKAEQQSKMYVGRFVKTR